MIQKTGCTCRGFSSALFLSQIAVPLALAVAVPAAHAAGGLILIDPPPSDLYTLAIGAGLAGYPEAPGSSRIKTLVFPGVDFYSSLGGFASTENGIGWNFSRRQDLQYGLRLWPIFSRDDDESRQEGLTDVGTRLGKAVFLNYAPWEFLTLQSNVMVGSAYHGDGVLVEAGATVGAPIGNSTLLGLTLGTTWANGPHMRSYYGVSAAESAVGGLRGYTPSSGILDVNLALNGEVKFSPDWKLSGQVLAARLQGDAANSPVTHSRIQTTFQLTLWYQIK